MLRTPEDNPLEVLVCPFCGGVPTLYDRKTEKGFVGGDVGRWGLYHGTGQRNLKVPLRHTSHSFWAHGETPQDAATAYNNEIGKLFKASLIIGQAEGPGCDLQ